MELFNIGLGELLIILILMYVLLGPQGMLRAARWLGRMTQQAYRFFNETWRSITDVPMDIHDLPKAILKETGFDDIYTDIRQESRAVRAELNQSVGQVNASIKPPGAGGAVAGTAAAGTAAAASTAAAPAPAGKNGPARINLKDAATTPAETAQPGAESAAVEGAAQTTPDTPRYGRGRPRKGEVRPAPPPREPRKRGRPPKNRPEATAAPEPPEEQQPFIERPAESVPRFPRSAPGQPGGPLTTLNIEQAAGARAYDSKPAPSGDLPDEENDDPDAA
jgi:sec-independent protein translocase protein TatB